MTDPILDHFGPWSEEEYLAIGESTNRIELVDGSLWVTPSPSLLHNEIVSELEDRVRPQARDSGLRGYRRICVRLGPCSVVVPDISVTEILPPTTVVSDTASVVLVGEIVSSVTATIDLVHKMHLYAAAGIGWYLVVEPDSDDYNSLTLRLLRLQGTRYFEHAQAAFGETLTSQLPFPLTLPTKDLLDW